MLHITNGDAAVASFRAAGISGTFLPWRDVLHEGPVPTGLSPAELDRTRVRFLVSLGWGEEAALAADFASRRATLDDAQDGEVALWFEHDLYDQLQLLQVLAELPTAVQPAVIVTDDFLTALEPATLRSLAVAPPRASPAERAQAGEYWEAFRGADPAQWRLRREETGLFRHLPSALDRLREELPGEGDGLSRTERQILETIATTPGRTPAAAFGECARREEAAFLGDLGFALHLRRLTAVAHPLLRGADGEPLEVPQPPEPPQTPDGATFWKRPLALTGTGQRCLEGLWHHHDGNGVERWLGGVWLRPGQAR